MAVETNGDVVSYDTDTGRREALGVVVLAGEPGGGGGQVEVTNFPETQAVSGTVTVSGLATAGSTNIGAVSAAAYADDTGAANGTLVALLKGIYVQNAAIIALLTQIETNTNTSP